MTWLRRRSPPPPGGAGGPADPVTGGGTVQAAPGMGALLEGLHAEGVDTVLDLGPATQGNLVCFSRFARRIRVADLASSRRTAGSLRGALEELRRLSDGPYGLVLAWNVLDQVSPEQRPAVVSCVSELTEPGARLHFMIDMSDKAFVRPPRFTVLGGDRVCRHDAGPPQPAQPRLLPADVERLVEPFRIVHAYVLRDGMREYVAVRR